MNETIIYKTVAEEIRKKEGSLIVFNCKVL